MSVIQHHYNHPITSLLTPIDRYDAPANNGQGEYYTTRSPSFNSNEVEEGYVDPGNLIEDVPERKAITFRDHGNQNVGSGSISIGGGQYIS